MEKLDMKKVRCQAKVAGTLVTVAGAMMMTLYKGPLMQMALSSSHGHKAEAPVATVDPSGKEWFLGSLFVIIATLAWASLFILQTHTLRQYSAPLSLTTLICFVGTIQAVFVTFAMEHRPSAWTIGFDMNLLAAAYAVSLRSTFCSKCYDFSRVN
jgi:drug/metabolite transporter (DMT)-like permease